MAETQWIATTGHLEGFAPMTLTTLQQRVEQGRQEQLGCLLLKFTHRSDAEIVVELQEQIFNQQTRC